MGIPICGSECREPPVRRITHCGTHITERPMRSIASLFDSSGDEGLARVHYDFNSHQGHLFHGRLDLVIIKMRTLRLAIQFRCCNPSPTRYVLSYNYAIKSCRRQLALNSSHLGLKSYYRFRLTPQAEAQTPNAGQLFRQHGLI